MRTQQRQPVDPGTRARIDRLLARLRARLERAAADHSTGQIHVVVELRQGQLTADTHVTGLREYPLR